MSKPTPLELSLTRAIDRHYRSNRDLRVSDIRRSLKAVDRMLLTMVSKVRKKWRNA